MGHVSGNIYYCGEAEAPKTPPPKDLMLPDGSLCQMFREALLKSQQRFHTELRIQDFPLVHCEWMGCGQTAGVAAWHSGEAWDAVTAYFNGLDPKEEVMAIETALIGKRLPIALHQWHDVLSCPKPLFATFILTLSGHNNPVIATAAPALANSFFSIMGTV